jgi:HAD superfamily hydrolase (TIGR01509 family)
MLHPPQNLKAIFFDLDNVLVFSEVMHFQAWQIVIQALGINPALLDFQSLIGISDSQQAVILKDLFNLKQDPTEIWKMKRQAFFKLIPNGLDAPKGREIFLKNISSRYITAVVSSSGRQVIQEILQSENIVSYFKFIIGHEDCIRHKPDPLPYLHALEKAQIQPHEALVIEDSVSGIMAALNAFIPVIGIFKDQTPDQLLENVRYFNGFDEIDVWFHEQQAPTRKVI